VNLLKSFGDILVECLEEKNINQKEFAKLLNVKEYTVSRYKTGKREPDLETVKKMSEVLQVPVQRLLGADKKDFANRENKKVEKELDKVMDDLMSSEGLMLNGEAVTPEALKLLRNAMKIGIEMAKEENKKYIPKKYRKE